MVRVGCLTSDAWPTVCADRTADTEAPSTTLRSEDGRGACGEPTPPARPDRSRFDGRRWWWDTKLASRDRVVVITSLAVLLIHGGGLAIMRTGHRRAALRLHYGALFAAGSLLG